MSTPQERAEAIRKGVEKSRRDFLAYSAEQESAIYTLMQQSAGNIASRIEKAEKDGKIPSARLRPLLDNIKAEMAALRPKIKSQIVQGMRNSVDYGMKAAVQGMSGAELAAGVKTAVGSAFVGADGKVRRYDAKEESYQDSKWGKINKNAMAALIKFQPGGITLSDRVWDLAWSAEKALRNRVQLGIVQGDSASKLSRDVRGFLAQPDTLRGKARELYHPGTGVYRSAYQNAMRFTRTEYNRAFNEGLYRYASEKDWVTGYVWHVGGSNPCEECDGLDGDFFDKGSEPDIPLHPNCMCYLTLETDENKHTQAGYKESPEKSAGMKYHAYRNMQSGVEGIRQESDTSGREISGIFSFATGDLIPGTKVVGDEGSVAPFRHIEGVKSFIADNPGAKILLNHTHNQGTSFSVDDLVTWAQNKELPIAGTVVDSGNYRHVLLPGENQIPSEKFLQERWNYHLKSIDASDFRSKSKKETMRKISGEVLKRVANDAGLKYSKVKI